MRKLLAITLLGAAVIGLAPLPAQAGAATDAALGLGAFAVFNQLFGPWAFRPWYGGYWGPYPYYYPSYPMYYAPPVAYAPRSVEYVAPSAPAAPLVQREVVFPHGRYVLQGDGMTTAYQWIWVPNLPPAPSAPPPGR